MLLDSEGKLEETALRRIGKKGLNWQNKQCGCSKKISLLAAAFDRGRNQWLHAGANEMHMVQVHVASDRTLTESSPIELSRRLALLLFVLATLDVIIER